MSADTTIRARSRWYFASTIGTKVLIAATGLLLVLYLVLHLAGNVLIFFGPATLNGYSRFLLKNPLIYPIEVGLAAIFVLHVYKTIANWIQNRRARPVDYYQPVRRFFGWGWAGFNSRKSLASSTMIVSGLLTLVFVVVHLRHFKFGPEGTDDLYSTEIRLFSSLGVVAFYIFSMVVVGAHLWHGFSSAFNSLGADHPRYTGVLLRIGRILALVVAGGFMLIPVTIYLGLLR